MRGLLIAIATAGALYAQSASATTVLTDNFDSSGTPNANWPGDSVFTSVIPIVSGDPSVDLVGPGYFDNLAFVGSSIDLDGSTGSGNFPAGGIESLASLALGDYEVQFYLAGNMNRSKVNQTTTVSIGGASQTITPSSPAQGYLLYTLFFNDVSGNLLFEDSGPSDQQGNLLDEVTVATTPLPATWTMMLIGLAGLGFAAYRKQQKRAPGLAAS